METQARVIFKPQHLELYCEVPNVQQKNSLKVCPDQQSVLQVVCLEAGEDLLVQVRHRDSGKGSSFSILRMQKTLRHVANQGLKSMGCAPAGLHPPRCN